MEPNVEKDNVKKDNVEKETVVKKKGAELKFEAKLTVKDLWAFSMYHANAGLRGVFNLLFTAAALFLLVFKWGSVPVSSRILLVLCVLLFTVWQPFLLYTKARKQAKAPAIRDAMCLTFSEEGLKVEQSGQTAEFAWDQMGRMDRMRSMIVLYMDRVHAYLLPKSVTGEQEEALCEMARKYLPKERRRKI